MEVQTSKSTRQGTSNIPGRNSNSNSYSNSNIDVSLHLVKSRQHFTSCFLVSSKNLKLNHAVRFLCAILNSFFFAAFLTFLFLFG